MDQLGHIWVPVPAVISSQKLIRIRLYAAFELGFYNRNLSYLYWFFRKPHLKVWAPTRWSTRRPAFERACAGTAVVRHHVRATSGNCLLGMLRRAAGRGVTSVCAQGHFEARLASWRIWPTKPGWQHQRYLRQGPPDWSFEPSWSPITGTNIQHFLSLH